MATTLAELRKEIVDVLEHHPDGVGIQEFLLEIRPHFVSPRLLIEVLGQLESEHVITFNGESIRLTNVHVAV